jgi:hypothetical protein
MDLLQNSAQRRDVILAILSFSSAARFTTYVIRNFMHLNSYSCNRWFVWVWNLDCYVEGGMSNRVQACWAEENGWA